jgi:hypothetical protein
MKVTEAAMYSITVNQILDLGIARSTVNQNINKRKWKTLGKKMGRYADDDCQALLSSLPFAIQMKWLQLSSQTDPDQRTSELEAIGNLPVSSADEELECVLRRYSHQERLAFCEEACRLFDLISRYDAIKPKRELDPESATYVYVSAVLQLCDEAVCTSPIILKTEPHRVNPPSPHTLRRWSQKCRKEGVLAFFRVLPQSAPDINDQRRAVISIDAIYWINDNWKRFRGARALYTEVKRISESKGWIIPSESWFYRAWNQIPKIVQTYLFKGEAAYISKYAPFVPRDLSNLEALQVLCGDHSEREVIVLLKAKYRTKACKAL